MDPLRRAAMPEKTIFKKMLDGEIPVEFVYEDDRCIAIRDINPQAPVHLLIIPRKELISLAHADESDAALLGHLLIVCRKLAEQEGLSQGYRVVVNAGPHGGQTVDHLHIHLLGKRALGWPPG
jgi:histidine triad (HIT) family protein